MLILIATIFLISCILLYSVLTPKRPANFPPGPKNIPLIGGSWIIKKLDTQFSYSMMKLGEKYGPVTGIHLGMMRSVVINGYDAVKEVLTRDEFQGRPDILFNKLTYGNKMGLMFSEGELWKEQRRFTLRHLRDFGFGKGTMEQMIHTEIEECLERLEKNMECVPMGEVFGAPVINCLWKMIVGKRHNHDDPQFLHLLNMLYKLFRSGNSGSNWILSMIESMPLLRFFPIFSRKWNEMTDCRYAALNMIEEEISWHSKTRDKTFNRDFIDLYLKEIEEGGNSTNFSKKQLLVICSDLFNAGSESTSNSLAFGMLYMILYPEVQKKIQEELDSIVGKNRLPSYTTDRANLPYTEAVLCELMRVAGIAPSTVPHCTMQDTRLCGYDIPKNTFVMVMLLSVHQDRSYWGDPQNFRPERFLDEDGKLFKTERLMGFGYGKRVCLGEVLARMTWFNFFTSILQKFKIEAYDETNKPSTVPVPGFTIAPQPFQAKLSLR